MTLHQLSLLDDLEAIDHLRQLELLLERIEQQRDEQYQERIDGVEA